MLFLLFILESEERIERYEDIVRDIMASNKDEHTTYNAAHQAELSTVQAQPTIHQAQASSHQAQPSTNHQSTTHQIQASTHQPQPFMEHQPSSHQAHPYTQQAQPDLQPTQLSMHQAEEMNVKRVDDEVRIPLSYLTQAMPLINLLVNNILIFIEFSCDFFSFNKFLFL